jgi:hypothetical protein
VSGGVNVREKFGESFSAPPVAHVDRRSPRSSAQRSPVRRRASLQVRRPRRGRLWSTVRQRRPAWSRSGSPSHWRSVVAVWRQL